MPFFYMKQMRTQLDDLKQELKDIEKTLTLHLMFNNLPEQTKQSLLKRAEIVRSIIYNMM